MTKKSRETKDRILKAARRLFSQHGVDGTSLRAITAAAHVNLAAINYHFGSKENLVTEVLMSFVYPLDAERNRILKAAENAAPDGIPRVQEVVTAYIQPWLDFVADHPGMLETYLRLYTSQDSNGSGQSFGKMLYAISRAPYDGFTTAIFRALPEISRETLTLRMNIAITAAASVLLNPWFNHNLEAMSGFALNRENLLDFVSRFIETGRFEKNDD